MLLRSYKSSLVGSLIAVLCLFISFSKKSAAAPGGHYSIEQKGAGEKAAKISFLQSFLNPNEKIYLDVISYDVKASYSWDEKVLSAVSTIKLETDSNRFSLNFKKPLSIGFVRLKGGKNLAYNHKDGFLNIDTKNDLQSEKKIYEIEVNYLVRGSSFINAGYTDSLIEVKKRPLDPTKGDVLYSRSEPIGASAWMPCHDVPSDRATFSFTMTMDESRMLLANGDLISDELANGKRTMSYKTDFTLPTYLMAFTVGYFQSHSTEVGGKEVSVWTRRGFTFDYEAYLKMLSKLMEQFTTLMGEYPFKSYRVVLLPEFPGGLENAGLSFQDEDWSISFENQAGRRLAAHELAHQWFGDYVTINTWDDIWIKEGMASLLEVESLREFEDKGEAKRYFADYFRVQDGYAVYDTKLPPMRKYNSGTYGRSAWFFTQLRYLVGEEQFWGIWQGIFRDHAWSTLSTDEMLSYIATKVDADKLKEIKKSLVAHKVPSLSLEKKEDSILKLSLNDEEDFLFTPIQLSVWSDDFSKNVYNIEKFTPQTINLEEAELLNLDDMDLHPNRNLIMEEDSVKLEQKMVFSDLKALPSFLEASSASQIQAFDRLSAWQLNPDIFASLMKGLDSSRAKFMALRVGCNLANETWKEALLTYFDEKDYDGVGGYYSSFTKCATLLNLEGKYKNIFVWMKDRIGVKSISLKEFSLVQYLNIDPALVMETWGNAAQYAANMPSKVMALRFMNSYLRNDLIASENLENWFSFYRDIVTTGLAPSIKREALEGISLLGGVKASKVLERVSSLHNHFTVLKAAVCKLYPLYKDIYPESYETVWAEYKARSAKENVNYSKIKRYLDDPIKNCQGRH